MFDGRGVSGYFFLNLNCLIQKIQLLLTLFFITAHVQKFYF
jgi:hypothetical protein